jgi:hypothetical protein
MGLKQQSQEVGGRAPSLNLQVGEVATILIDCDKDARAVTRHALVKGGNCTGGGCKLCIAEIPKTTKMVVDAYRHDGGVWVPVAIWFRLVEFGRFGEVLPANGKAVLLCKAEPVIGDDGKPKQSNGRLWRDLTWTLQRQDTAGSMVTSDGEVIESAGLH